MNAFVELLSCSFAVIEFAFCLYSCDFSVWDYHSITLPLWPSVSSQDSVVIASWSSLDSDVIISSDLLNVYLAVESSLLFVVLLVMYLCNLLL